VITGDTSVYRAADSWQGKHHGLVQTLRGTRLLRSQREVVQNTVQGWRSVHTSRSHL